MEEELYTTCQRASGAIGFFISMGLVIESESFMKKFHCYIPVAKKHLSCLSYRVHRSYALLLAIADEVRIPLKLVLIMLFV